MNKTTSDTSKVALKTLSFEHFWLGHVLRATAACTLSTSNGNQTVQKWPEHVVILTFLLKMCFASQRRALFQHLNFQKSSKPDVFWRFLLPNVLGATTAGTFSTSELPRVVRRCGVLYMFTWKCASRHYGVHFFDIEWQSNRQKVARTCGNFNIFRQHVLRTTTACTFSTSQLPKVARTCGNFYMFTQNVLRATLACTFASLQLPKVVGH